MRALFPVTKGFLGREVGRLLTGVLDRGLFLDAEVVTELPLTTGAVRGCGAD